MNWLRIPVVIGLLIILSLLPLVLSHYFLGIVTQMMIYAIFAMSLDILMGYTRETFDANVRACANEVENFVYCSWNSSD